MDQLPPVDIQHGLKGILLSLVGLIAANVAAHIVKGVWIYAHRNRRPTREQFRELTKAFEAHNELLAEQKTITKKMGMDLRRIYLYLKVIAGDQWPKYRKQVEEIEKEDLLNS